MKSKQRLRNFELLSDRYLLAADFNAADFNGDQRVNAEDIDLLATVIRAGRDDVSFDLTEDGEVSIADIDYLVGDLLQTVRGDANLDRVVDTRDFISLSAGFGREVGWSSGNFYSRIDTTTGIDDFLHLSRNFGFAGSELIFTHVSADGNRYTQGWGNIDEVEPVDIQLDFEPQWVLGASSRGPFHPYEIWVAVGELGQTQAFNVTGTAAIPTPIETISARTPPLGRMDFDAIPEVSLVRADEANAAVPSHPIRFGENLEKTAFIDTSGNVVIDAGGEPETLDVGALPDARILSDGEGRLLVLTNPSTIYQHGIFGDRIEPRSVTLIDTNVSPPSTQSFAVPENRVIENLFATWTDVDDDGEREIVVTISDSRNGGQITIYDEAGDVVAQGPGIGRGFRWRHQIAVAPFGPNGETELVDVRTPHIGGIVEFRSLEEPDLPIVASVPGYTSHVNRSRNIDMAVAGDFDGDDRVELLLPNQRRTTLAAIQRTDNGAIVDWELPLDGTLTSNVAVNRHMNGRISVGVGLADNRIRIWRSSPMGNA